MNILIIFLGLLLIAFIIWWFWLKKSGHEKSTNQGIVEVTVDNGVYTPDTIKAKVGQPIKLRFIRKTESPCAKTVIFDQLNVSHELPFNEPYEFELTVNKAGEYAFTCEMGMYRGKLIVKEN